MGQTHPLRNEPSSIALRSGFTALEVSLPLRGPGRSLLRSENHQSTALGQARRCSESRHYSAVSGGFPGTRPVGEGVDSPVGLRMIGESESSKRRLCRNWGRRFALCRPRHWSLSRVISCPTMSDLVCAACGHSLVDLRRHADDRRDFHVAIPFRVVRVDDDATLDTRVAHRVTAGVRTV